jgi:hypothetical protein
MAEFLKGPVRYLIGACAFFFIITHLHNIKWFSNIPNVISEIKGTFSGRITEKRMRHTSEIIVKTPEKTGIIYNADGDFFATSRVGDSIYKIPNDDSVYLIRENYKKKFKYQYISTLIYEDPLWPAEWRDKWKDSDQIKGIR